MRLLGGEMGRDALEIWQRWQVDLHVYFGFAFLAE